VNDALVALYAEAVAALGSSDDDVLRARLLGQLAVELINTSERERRHALSAEALAIARRAGDRLELAHVLIARVRAITDPTTLAERLALTAELEVLADDLGNLELSQTAAYRRVGTLIESGDPVGAARALARCDQLAVQLRVPFFNYYAQVARAGWSLMCGSPEAERQALSAFKLGRSLALPIAADALSYQLGEIRYRQGRLGEIFAAVRAYVESQPDSLTVRATVALLCYESDRLAEAREHFELLAANGFDLPLGTGWAGSMFHLAEVCGALRDARAAALVYPKLEPLAEQVGVVGIFYRCDGSLGHAAGVLAACLQRWEDAERHFEHAVAMNDRLGARPAAVRTRRAYAAMLVERNAPGDRQRAAELITAALAETEQLDVPAEVAKLQRLRGRL
jgi:tetratricopeptide (TPR) repeat protein